MKIFSHFAAAFLVVFFFGSSVSGQSTMKADADRIWQLLEQGNTEDSFWFLTDLFKKNGAEIDTDGTWKLKLKVQDYKELINKYSNGDVSITVSRMMRPEETAEYWENWSRVLAAGNFDHIKFFRNDRERFLLANFNVLILSAHEIGHYLDFRYRISNRDYSSGFLTDNDPLNCTENFADKFAVATINHLAKDPRFAELRPRYLELIRSFNASIPTGNRYNFDSFDFVGKRCGEPDLMKNGVNPDGVTVNENFFRQYSSAYFNRQRLMLENTAYGDLSAVIKTQLVEPYFSRLNYPSDPLSVKTLNELKQSTESEIYLAERDFKELVGFERELEGFKEERRAERTNVAVSDFAINDTGAARIVEVKWNGAKTASETEQTILSESRFTLNYGTTEGKNLARLNVLVPKSLRSSYNLSSFVALNDNELILVMTPFDLMKTFDFVVILQLKQTKGRWTDVFKKFSLPELKNAEEIGSGWSVTPSGKLVLMRKQRTQKLNTVKLSLYEINRRTLSALLMKPEFEVDLNVDSVTDSSLTPLRRSFDWTDGAFVNDAGRIFITGAEGNLQLGSDGRLFEIKNKAKLLLGNMSGIVDDDNAGNIRISNIAAGRFISENRVVFIDKRAKQSFLREVVFR